jgi:DNA repair photolyase
MATEYFSTPLTITSQFSFCGLPLRLDSYAGCGFRCSFCFARFRGGNSFGENIRPANPQALHRIFRRAFDPNTSSDGLLSQFLRRRVPVHFGGMSDPFQPSELRHRVTESFLRALAQFTYPTVLSTRSTLVAAEPYLSLLKKIEHLVVQFSFCSTRDRVAKQFEPYSPPPSELLAAMAAISESGIKVTCRWQPYIPSFSEPASEFASRVSSTGCRHIALEHLKVPVERNHALWTQLTTAAQRDFHSEYKAANALRDGREFVLPSIAKLPAILEAAKAARSCKMTFGAADNEFQYISDADCCCSGVDQFPGFENWFKHQIGYAVRKCRGTRITYDSVSREWAPTGSIDRFLNSRSRLSSRSELPGTLRDHVRGRWNSSSAPGCPASFYGVAMTNQTTSSGLKAYSWDQELLRSLRDAPASYAPTAQSGCDSNEKQQGLRIIYD